MLISIDSEVTGLDVHHGATPYFVTVCTDDRKVHQWEWPVNPADRVPKVRSREVDQIRAVLEKADVIAGQNIRFDVHALHNLGITEWPWHKTVDTLIASHLLASNQPHDLTSLAMHYCGLDILPFEEHLKEACLRCRQTVRSRELGWRIAKAGLPEMPSVKSGGKAKSKGGEDESPWKADGWLPRAVAAHYNYEPSHHFWTVLSDYGNADAQATLMVWQVMESELRRRGLGGLFTERMKLLPIVWGMEHKGVTYHEDTLDDVACECAEDVETLKRRCVSIASGKGYDLSLPRGATNNGSLMSFVFGPLGLPVVRRTDKGNASFDKTAIDEYIATCEGEQLEFVRSLRDARQRGTDLMYLENYRRFGLPFRENGAVVTGVMVLHPNLNPTGTAHLRFSMSNPNSANVSKQEDECEHCEGEGCGLCHNTGKRRRSLREVFGPAPGRVWYRFDYENIEQRIPAYHAPEPAMIELFERPDDPPYFGSYHLLNASIVYPDLFWPLADKKGEFKRLYASTWYQWIKNFGFAKNYGGGEATCDRAAHRKGAYRAVGEKLPGMAKLNARMIAQANRDGFIVTLPDRRFGRGYPIWTSRSSWGGVSPTVPLNYFVSGTAMWCTCSAMVRVDEYLREVNRRDPRDYRMVLQVHDELVCDFPADGPDNVKHVKEIKRLMEMSGDDIGIPLKVSVGFHPDSWAEEEEMSTAH